MDDRFRLLDMGAIDLPERHQTLKAAIDWSYESLSPAKAQFLRRLAVFSGGFSIAAAQMVGECEARGLNGLEILIALVRLVTDGFSSQEIAERLFITERTVRFHVNSIFNKLGANNRAQAVAIASRLGLL